MTVIDVDKMSENVIKTSILNPVRTPLRRQYLKDIWKKKIHSGSWVDVFRTLDKDFKLTTFGPIFAQWESVKALSTQWAKSVWWKWKTCGLFCLPYFLFFTWPNGNLFMLALESLNRPTPGTQARWEALQHSLLFQMFKRMSGDITQHKYNYGLNVLLELLEQLIIYHVTAVIIWVRQQTRWHFAVYVTVCSTQTV